MLIDWVQDLPTEHSEVHASWLERIFVQFNQKRAKAE